MQGMVKGEEGDKRNRDVPEKENDIMEKYFTFPSIC